MCGWARLHPVSWHSGRGGSIRESASRICCPRKKIMIRSSSLSSGTERVRLRQFSQQRFCAWRWLLGLLSDCHAFDLPRCRTPPWPPTVSRVQKHFHGRWFRGSANRVPPMRPSLLVLFTAAFMWPAARGYAVTLVWDASKDRTVTSYRVYYGTAPRIYTSNVTVGNVTTATIENARLIPGATYYFAVTARNAFGDESVYSNQVKWVAPIRTLTPSLPDAEPRSGRPRQAPVPDQSCRLPSHRTGRRARGQNSAL